MLALLVDWGVLCLPAVPGVLWVLASEAKKSLFIPLCLDVVLQVWQVAIWDQRKGMKPLILHVRHPSEQNKGFEVKASERFPEEYFLKQSSECSVKALETTHIMLIYLPACGNPNVGRWGCSRFKSDQTLSCHSCLSCQLCFSGTHGSLLWLNIGCSDNVTPGPQRAGSAAMAAVIRSAYKPWSYTGQPTASQMSDTSIAISQLGNSSQ